MDASPKAPAQPGFLSQEPVRRAEQAEFLARIGHEIRTPLNAIIGYAEMLEKTTLDEKQRHYTTNIVRGGLALTGILNEWLKQAKGETADDKVEQTPPPQTAPRSARDTPFTLLVVANSPLLCDLFTDIFSGSDSRVLTATSGKNALELAASALPRLIFIDLQLADTDGWTLAAQLQDSPATALLPRIVMTEQDLKEDEYKPDFVDFLQKPFQLQKLQELVRHWRDRNEAQSQSVSAPAARQNLADTMRPFWNKTMQQLLHSLLHTGSLPLAIELGESMVTVGGNERCDALHETGLRLAQCARLSDIVGMEAIISQLTPLLGEP